MVSALVAPSAALSIDQLHSRCVTPSHSYRAAAAAASMAAARGGKRGVFLPRAGLCYTSSWSSWIQHNRLQCSQLLSRARHRSTRRFRAVVSSSLLGVGAPEVLVIAVVALLVFGPKGLAEVARSLGQSLRAFQPTIRELQDVSREFKKTLEKEIGLDEIKSPSQRPIQPTEPAPPPVNENFVMEEITAQLNLMQQEKEKAKEASAAAAQEPQQQEPNPAPPSAAAVDDSTSEAVAADDNSSSPAPVEVPAKEKEAASVNNVPKD